jgi:hypothetical protein
VDEWITGKTPYYYLDLCEKLFYLTHSIKRYRLRLTLLPLIREAVDNTFFSYRLLQVVGLLLLPVVIVYNIIKPLYYISRIVIALSQNKYERMKAENQISDEILESLVLSLETVLKMVIRLCLEIYKAIE